MEFAFMLFGCFSTI